VKAKVIGGPYDGTELDANDVNLYTKFWPVGHRKFILMPPFDKWDEVRQGTVDKNADLGMREVYELVRTQDGMSAVHDPSGAVFHAALVDEREGRGPQPVAEPFTGSYYQCIRGKWALSRPGYFAIRDDKDREWACCEIPRHEAERDDVLVGMFEIRAIHEESGTNERLSVSTRHCDSVDELPAQLADVID
jgi:hypothetical protein